MAGNVLFNVGRIGPIASYRTVLMPDVWILSGYLPKSPGYTNIGHMV